VDLLENRVPAGVDPAAYVKAAFLAAVTKGEATSSLVTKEACCLPARHHAGWLQR
jgi:aconitate hydratase 2/2-methylisocitrate dehydratase